MKWKKLLSVALAWSRLRAVSYFSLQSYYIYKHRRNEGVSPRRKNKIAVTGHPLRRANFSLYICSPSLNGDSRSLRERRCSLGRAKTPGGGGVFPYISHLGMCHRISVGLMHRFGLKTGTDFVYFGLESGTGFEGTTDVSERIVSIPKE